MTGHLKDMILFITSFFGEVMRQRVAIIKNKNKNNNNNLTTNKNVEYNNRLTVLIWFLLFSCFCKNTLPVRLQ